MQTRTLWSALLLVAAAACSEGGSPVDTPWERAFDIAVPTFRQLSTTTPEPVRSQPTSAVAASYSHDPADLPDDYAQLLASGTLITHASEADAGFATDHMVAYGQALGRSRGSYYKNSVKLRLFYQGSAVAENSGEMMDSCLCLHLWSPWGEIANTTIGVGTECGHMAQVDARHDARLDFTTPVKVYTLLAQSGTDSEQAFQPPCGVASQNGGGGDGEWYICYWEDWYNEDGIFLRRVELFCAPYHGNVY
jgi:hypothetical protein